MLNTLATAAEEAARIVSEYFSGPIGTLEGLAVPLAASLSDAQQAGALSIVRVDAVVEPFAIHLRDLRPVPVYGAGFIAALDLVKDSRGYLSWWQGEDWRKLVLAAQTVNKERIDYSELEWFRVPALTSRSHVAGPYVDYLCSDEYTITIATPVFIDGVFSGVAAFDLLIDAVERELTPQLDDLGIDVTIVNGVGRVVISTDPSRATGDTIRDATDKSHQRLRCDGIELDVLVSPSSS